MLERIVIVVTQIAHVHTEDRLVNHENIDTIGLFCALNYFSLVSQQHYFRALSNVFDSLTDLLIVKRLVESFRDSSYLVSLRRLALFEMYCFKCFDNLNVIPRCIYRILKPLSKK